MEKKDSIISIRISKEHKQQIKIRAIEKGYTLGEYVLYCIMREISESEINKLK